MKFTEVLLDDKVYKVSLTVVVCPDIAQWNRSLDDVGYTGDRGTDAADARYYRLTPDNNKMKHDTSVIFLRTKKMGPLVHELAHFVFNVFDDRGVEVRIENDEAFAYYLEYWTNGVLDAWRKQNA